MAHLLRITDNNGTVNFNSGNQSLLAYVPRSPNLSTVNFTPEALRDGGERPSATRRNVTESAQVLFTGTAVTDVQAAVGSVELYLKQAEEYQAYRSGSPVYIEFQPNGAGDVYRSEILSGKVEMDDMTLSAGQWNRNKARAVVAYTRRHYWEGPETELVLYNSGGSGTGGRTVYNCDDGTPNRDNYLEIAGTSVIGNAKAPIRLEMTNTYAVTPYLRRVHIGHNVFANPTSITHILEAESATGLGSAVSSSISSGGTVQAAISCGTATETDLLTWTLTAAMLNNYNGRYFRTLPRFSGGNWTDIKLRWQLRLSGATVWAGPQVTASGSQLQDIGVLQLPPRLANMSNLYALSLVLTGQKTGGATFDLDFVGLLPTDSLRTVETAVYYIQNNESLIDDELTHQVYAKIAGGFESPIAITKGPPIMLYPGKVQRLYFLSENSAGSAEVERTMSVRAYYRPRKLTI